MPGFLSTNQMIFSVSYTICQFESLWRVPRPVWFVRAMYILWFFVFPPSKILDWHYKTDSRSVFGTHFFSFPTDFIKELLLKIKVWWFWGGYKKQFLKLMSRTDFISKTAKRFHSVLNEILPIFLQKVNCLLKISQSVYNYSFRKIYMW